MNSQEMEACIKDLMKQVSQLNNQVGRLNDIENIQRLQRSYGYFIQNWMYQELVDLFADSPQAELNILGGVFISKAHIEQYFVSLKMQYDNPEFLHQLMQISGIVDVAPDGNTAQGRWFAYGGMAIPYTEGVKPIFADGIYSVDYLKQDGIWKILKLKWNPIFLSLASEGWVKKERLQTNGSTLNANDAFKPDKPRDIDPRYPSGYIVPFHYKHPVTGTKVEVEKHNAALKPVKR